MDDISNRTLALLLVVAIVVSLTGTWISFFRLEQLGRYLPGITGAATDTSEGSISLTISAITEVNFTTASIAWGTGAVDVGANACDIDSDGETGSNNNCTSDPFDSVTTGLVLENVGNKNVTLNISCGKTAASLLGGTGPSYSWNVTESDTDSCSGGLHRSTVSDTNVSFTACTSTQTYVCNETGSGFLFNDTKDEFTFHIRLHIPSDSVSGVLTDTITAHAETLGG